MATNTGETEQTDTRQESSAPVRLLHVDDDSALVDMAARFMERAADGLSVATETDPQAVQSRLATADEPFDCVLADYEMPRLDGLELLDRLRGAGHDLPFVLFTGKGNEAIAGRAVSAGVTDYIRKGRGTDQYAVVANRVTEAVAQVRAEAALERNEHHYRRLMETAPTPITTYDVDGVYVYANRAAACFFGVPRPAALVGHSKFDVMAPDEHDGIERRLGRLADGEQLPAAEHEYDCLDGQRRTGVASCGPAVVQGKAAGVSVIRETTGTDVGREASDTDERTTSEGTVDD
jgi:PAS domain S-box-containing protein